MNLIDYKYEVKPVEKDGKIFYPLKDFRKIDYQKIKMFIEDMYGNITKIDDNFHYTIEYRSNISKYLGDFQTYNDEIIIDQNFGSYNKKINVLIPKLLQDNYFILNNTLYVPLLFLEKSPIDRVRGKEGKEKNRIFANINSSYNFTFDFEKKLVFHKIKALSMDIFYNVVFKDDPEYLEHLLDIGLIETINVNKGITKKFVRFMGFHRDEYFDEEYGGNDIVKWVDNYVFLSYYKEMFDDYYGTKNLWEVFKKIIEFYETDEDIDMANLKNRRLVMVEYLIKPIFEVYQRLLYGIIDKKTQNFLPTVNQNTVITSGFNQLMHRGNLYDLSLPFAAPLINKVSQDIQIITDGRLPKSWVRNDPSAYGKFCPVSVSAQKTSSNIIGTSDLKVNKYGRLLID